MKKLKNILLATTFGLSFGLNQGYSQETSGKPRRQVDYGDYYYCLNGKSYHKLWSKWDDGTTQSDDIRTPQNDGECQGNNPISETTQENKNSNLSKVTQKEWENAYDKNSQPKKKPNTNYTYIPSKTNNNYFTPGEEILMGTMIIGGTAILNAILKPRNKAPINNSYPANSSPNNYNSNSGNFSGEVWKPKNLEWDWQDKKTEEIKRADENFWDEKSKELEKEKLASKKRAKEKLKELSDLVEKQIEHSPKTKNWFDEEVKKADEFYKEFYRADPKAYAEAQKLDDLHKIISYNAYQAAKEHTPAGPVIEGMEIYNELEEKGIENYWKDEIKRAEEFYEEKGYSVETSYKIVGKGYNGYQAGKGIQTNITIDEKIRKVIGYEVYKTLKEVNPANVGTLIENKEKYFPEKTANWWDK